MQRVPGGKETPPLWLREICEEMRENRNFVLGLPYMVERSGKTKEHLSRCMQKYYGQTPTQFINALRLDDVAEKLRHMKKDEKILPLMHSCGFQSVGHFYKQFKERFGVTPAALRK